MVLFSRTNWLPDIPSMFPLHPSFMCWPTFLFCFLYYCLFSKFAFFGAQLLAYFFLCYVCAPKMMAFAPLPKYQILPHIFISWENSLWEQNCLLKISSWHYKYKYSDWSYHLHSVLLACLFCCFSQLFHICPVSLSYILDFFPCNSLSLTLSNQSSSSSLASGFWVCFEYSSLPLCYFILDL